MLGAIDSFIHVIFGYCRQMSVLKCGFLLFVYCVRMYVCLYMCADHMQGVSELDLQRMRGAERAIMDEDDVQARRMHQYVCLSVSCSSRSLSSVPVWSLLFVCDTTLQNGAKRSSRLLPAHASLRGARRGVTPQRSRPTSAMSASLTCHSCRHSRQQQADKAATKSQRCRRCVARLSLCRYRRTHRPTHRPTRP